MKIARLEKLGSGNSFTSPKSGPRNEALCKPDQQSLKSEDARICPQEAPG